ncbi:MAG: cyclic pyranopterin phosphate synthase, partial [Pirellulaceae bacterium]
MNVLTDPLVDSLGRVHTNLRISVTDRCNIRCFYCMPNENVDFRPRAEILSYEEIARFANVSARMGVTKLRLTGGEPLVRSGVADLVRELVAIEGITDVAMTTNGVLLAEHAQALKDAGLHRLNVSLDGLKEETFTRISRRTGLQKVLDGIAAAKALGFKKLRLNAVAIPGISNEEIVPLGRFARENDFELRFIEFMPLDAEGNWTDAKVFTGEQIREILEAEFGALIEAPRPDPSQPALDYKFADGKGGLGFINPVSQPFCSSCNRLRITADGKVRNCLFSNTEWDARAALRSNASDEQMAQLIRDCIAAKKPGHGIDSPDFVRPQRAM